MYSVYCCHRYTISCLCVVTPCVVTSLLLSQQLRRHVDKFQAKLTVAKADYRTTLHNLETISEEIHSRRHSITMGTRGRGVGAEGEGGNEDITNFKMESDGLSCECHTQIRAHSQVLMCVYVNLCVFSSGICDV